jgi:hypothetical protein
MKFLIDTLFRQRSPFSYNRTVMMQSTIARWDCSTPTTK